MSTLKERIHASMIGAMRNKKKEELKTIRMLQAAIKQQEIDTRIDLDESQVLATISKMIKQRNESIKQFMLGNRPELAANEESEIAILQEFLPPQLNEEEINNIITKAIETTGASSIRDMGKVMASIKNDMQGKADMGKVGQLIKNRLSTT
jgi:uncharacterized protein